VKHADRDRPKRTLLSRILHQQACAAWVLLIGAIAAVVGAPFTGCGGPGAAIADRAAVASGQPLPASVVERLLDRHRVPGVSIVVLHGTRIDWAEGYGVRERGSRDPVDTTTLFQAASMSKPVAAAVALRMVADGKLRLDTDVNEALVSWKVPPSALTDGAPVTLRGLLSHSAGLPMHGVPEFETGEPLPALVEILDGAWAPGAERVRPVRRPGTEYSYSGGGYIVLQILLSDVAQRPFAPLARELVLEPAGMASSTFEQPLPDELGARAAVGHDALGRPLPGSWHVLPEQAAGGLWTTPRDLASFLLSIWRSYHGRSPALLPPPLAREMLTPQLGDMGLGFALPGAGVPRFQHGGGNAGYRCHMVLSIAPPSDGMVIMTNGDAGEPLIWDLLGLIARAYGWDH
jgi:CubicO group peptidase (beta-lactamase class C family)